MMGEVLKYGLTTVVSVVFAIFVLVPLVVILTEVFARPIDRYTAMLVRLARRFAR
jgi:ABC-type sulfate transport system permease subunit